MEPIDRKSAQMTSIKNANNVLSITPELRRKVHLSRHVCLHISEVSAVMLGICQSGVGLIHFAVFIRKVDTYVDNLLALDSLVFLTSCLTAYWGFRSSNIRKTLRLVRFAEGFFVIGLLTMVMVALLTTYSSIKK